MKDLQKRVKFFSEENGFDKTPVEFRALDLVSELGEVSKEILEMTKYGTKKLELNTEVKEELGDVLFSLISLANQLDTDLEEELNKVLKKYEKRLQKKGHAGSGNE